MVRLGKYNFWRAAVYALQGKIAPVELEGGSLIDLRDYFFNLMSDRLNNLTEHPIAASGF